MLCGGIAGQTVAPNPGGSVVVTNSTSATIQYVQTPVTQMADNYSTTITAKLNGSVVFSQTYAVAYSDSSVQNAVAQADAVLHGDGATYGSPLLTANSSTLQSSVTVTPPPVTCDQVFAGAGSPTGVVTNTTSVFFGPATIKVGDCQDEIFNVMPGQEDINVNTDTTFAVSQNVVTTNTYLVTQVYEIDGTPATSSCDLSSVQQLINQALGRASPVNDLNGDGKVNLVDVEIGIDTVLNNECPASASLFVYAANERGEQVGSANGHAVLLTQARTVDLGTLGGPESVALAIDTSGRIVGWSDTARGERHAFLWADGRMLDVNDFAKLEDGIVLEEATSFDAKGHVVSIGSDGNTYFVEALR
jgi:probable HAF family extracellular repeat protein